MGLRDTVRARLILAVERSELTIAQLSRRTGLSRRTIERTLGGDDVSWLTIERLDSNLRVDLANDPR